MPTFARDNTKTVLTPGAGGPGGEVRAESGPPQGTRIGTHYTVLETLGCGGMGIVLRARDERLERDVAVKLIRPALLDSPGAYERFLTEARAMARVSHSGVVGIHAFASPQEPPFFVMEYVPGSDLQALVDARLFSPAESLRVLRPLCEAVDAIHAAGFVHRDLKPRNILVGPGLRIVVTDLGLAHCLVAATGSNRPAPAGTPGYIAPELLLEGARIRFPQRIDVYALGALTYRLLVGHGAHDADTDEEIVDSQLHTKPAPPSEHNAELPAAVDEVLARALSIDPERRQESAAEFLKQLEDALSLHPRTLREIIVADDDDEMRDWITAVLREAVPGAKLTCVEDGSAALTAAKNVEADLIVTDLDMPSMDGVELTIALRDVVSDVPILVITAVGGAPEWKMLRELGANAFLPKPLDEELFCMTIQRLLASPR